MHLPKLRKAKSPSQPDGLVLNPIGPPVASRATVTATGPHPVLVPQPPKHSRYPSHECRGGVPLQDVAEECRRSIDVIVQVMNEDGRRYISEIYRGALR